MMLPLKRSFTSDEDAHCSRSDDDENSIKKKLVSEISLNSSEIVDKGQVPKASNRRISFMVLAGDRLEEYLMLFGKRSITSDGDSGCSNGFENSSEMKLALELISNSSKFVLEDWRTNIHQIRATYRDALSKSMLIDITFLVGSDSTQQTFPAHKLILALTSPVFEAMFFGGLAEKGPTVTIPDIHPEGFKYLLAYLYGENVYFFCYVEAFRAYIAADKYCVEAFKMKCEKFISTFPLTQHNIWKFIDFTHTYGCKSADRCIKYLLNDTSGVFRQEAFLEISYETMKFFLNLDRSKLPEYKVLKYSIYWALHKSMRNNVPFQNICSPILPYIYFGALTPAQFVRILKLKAFKNLLGGKDAFEILKHLCSPLENPLPDWCKKSCQLSPNKTSIITSASESQQIPILCSL